MDYGSFYAPLDTYDYSLDLQTTLNIGVYPAVDEDSGDPTLC